MTDWNKTLIRITVNAAESKLYVKYWLTVKYN